MRHLKVVADVRLSISQYNKTKWGNFTFIFRPLAIIFLWSTTERIFIHENNNNRFSAVVVELLKTLMVFIEYFLKHEWIEGRYKVRHNEKNENIVIVIDEESHWVSLKYYET